MKATGLLQISLLKLSRHEMRKLHMVQLIHFAKDMTTYVNRRGVADSDARIEWALGQMNDGDTISENITYLMGDGSYR